MAEKPSILPPAEASDSEDVAWALSTALVMESRGDWSECVRWLKRAAQAASEASRTDRALALAKAAADLAQQFETETTDVSSLAVKAAATAPEIFEAPTATASVVAPRPAAVSPGSFPVAQVASSPPAPSPRPPIASATEERQVTSSERPKIPAPKPIPRSAKSEHPAKSAARAPSAKVALGPMRARAPSTTEEWDAMPTQALSSEDLAHMARTEEIPALSAEVRASDAPTSDVVQSFRVRVWSDGNGVHVAPASLRVSAPSIEAVLVSVDGQDLAPWLALAIPRK